LNHKALSEICIHLSEYYEHILVGRTDGHRISIGKSSEEASNGPYLTAMAIVGHRIELTFFDPGKGDKLLKHAPAARALDEFKKALRKVGWA
jgi:hypothetical protein